MAGSGLFALGLRKPFLRPDRPFLARVIQANRQSRAPTWHEARESSWNYTLFGKASGERKPAMSISMVITRETLDENGMERWAINGRSYNPADKPEVLRRNHPYRILFKNLTEEDHRLHLHRARFELTSVQRKPIADVMKDVVVIRGYEAVESILCPSGRDRYSFIAINRCI